MRVGEKIVANHRVAVNRHEAVKHGIRSDLRAFVDEAVGADVRTRADGRGLGDDRGWVHTRCISRRLVKKMDGFGERKVGICGAQRCERRQSGVAVNRDMRLEEHSGSARGLQQVEVTAIGEKRQMAGLGILDAGDAGNFQVGGSFQSAVELRGNLGKSHGSPLLMGMRISSFAQGRLAVDSSRSA